MDARRKKALDRAAKLLALASSADANESAAAKRRLDEHLEKHGFTREEVEEHADLAERVHVDAGPLGDFWMVRVALAVADRITCQAVKRGDRIFFEGSPRRTSRAASAYAPIVRDIENGCGSVYASYGSPAVFAPVLRPILLEEAARAVAERIAGTSQPARFPVPPEFQEELLSWSKAMTGGSSSARIHIDWARRDGRVVGLAIPLGDLANPSIG